VADIVSKTCSDYLRECYSELKASHARELVAAFFGYKSHAALLADKRNGVDYLDQAAVLVPDSSLVDERRRCLKELSEQLPPSAKLVDELVQFVQDEELFTGEVWGCFDVGEYVIEEYLPAHLSPELDIELEELTKPLNALFEEISYDDCQVTETDFGVTVTVSGTYTGYWLDDNEHSDEPVIDLEITVYLRRCSGSISFDEPEIDVLGTLKKEDDDTDEEADDDDDAEEESQQPAAMMP
jgi:hypothetical protein